MLFDLVGMLFDLVGMLFDLVGMLFDLPQAATGLQTFRGFAGTSILILVGVATDTARKVSFIPYAYIVRKHTMIIICTTMTKSS
jgi:hypothetical protein